MATSLLFLADGLATYSGTPLKGHPWNKDTWLIRTLDRVPTLHKYVSFITPAFTNQDKYFGPKGARIRKVPWLLIDITNFHTPQRA